MSQKRKILYWLAIVVAVVGALTAGSPGDLFDPPAVEGEPVPTPSVTPDGQNPNRPVGIPAGAQEGRVTRIVDGDTIWVAISHGGGPIPVGDEHRVRMLEIDTPEEARPNHPVQCGGNDASAFAKAELPPGSTVYLRGDREDKDRFGRYLRYVWDFEGEFYNEKAAAEGYARAVLYRPNDRYISRMRQAEASARQDGRGMWGQVCGAAR